MACMAAQRYHLIRLCPRIAGEYISPEKENALSAGYVPVLSKFAPSSCYTQPGEYNLTFKKSKIRNQGREFKTYQEKEG